VGAGDRLGFSGADVWGGLHRQAGPAAIADAADGGASDPQAHLRPFRRGFVRSLGGEPVLPVLLRRGIFPTCVGVRPFVADPLATRTEAMKPSDLARVVIDTTVQLKAV